jgi:HAD superfamily hydrolase (TIGR01662 family)
MSVRAVAFDLGNTLVRYYDQEEFLPLLSDGIETVHRLFSDYSKVTLEVARQRAIAENVESADGRVRALQERFDRIFAFGAPPPVNVCACAAEAFLEPIFGCAQKYADTDEALAVLRASGYRLAIVSNTPWGSPSTLWRAELVRLGLSDLVDFALFCVDVGWRKPAVQIFESCLSKLCVKPNECVFVGDDRVWDVGGASAAGLQTILLDRNDRHSGYDGARLHNAADVARWVRAR